MQAIVIEHVNINDLPEPWRARLHASSNARVTIHIEEETTKEESNNPLFGMWSDREDMADVDAYMRKLRAPRFNLDGSRKKD